jgi:hypothetical protein
MGDEVTSEKKKLLKEFDRIVRKGIYQELLETLKAKEYDLE